MKKYLTILLTTVTSLSFADDEIFDGQSISNKDFTNAKLNYSSWRNAGINSTNNFTGASLKEADFTGASISVQKFGNANLTDSVFDNVKCENAKFDNANLTNASFLGARMIFNGSSYGYASSFKGANLSGAILSGLTLSSDKWYSVSFENANLTNADFSDTILTAGYSNSYSPVGQFECVFTGANLTGTNFTNAKLANIATPGNYKTSNAVSLQNTIINKTNFTGAILCAYTDMGGHNYSSVDFSNMTLTEANFTNAILSSKNWSGSYSCSVSFSNATLIDCIFTGAILGATGANTGVDFTEMDISNTSFAGATFNPNVKLNNCNIQGADFSSAINLTVSHINTTKSYADKNLSGVKFANLDLSSWTLRNQNLQNTSFVGTTLTNVNIRGADLRGADLTDAVDIDTVKIQNTIWNDGVIKNFLLESSDESFSIYKYTPTTTGGDVMSAKISESDAIISGGSELILEEGATFEISNGKKLSIEDGSLTIKTNNETSTIFTIESGSSLYVSENTSINIYVTVDESQKFILPIISWNENAIITGFDKLTKGINIKLYVNNVLYEGDWGTKIEDNSLIVFTIAPAHIAKQPIGLEVFSSQTGDLSVSATGEDLTYQWYFNEIAIEGATESTLSFENIQADKAGSYYCIITNPAGSVQSSSATVTVHQSATEDSLTKGLEKVTTVSGIGYARFEVETTAYNPTYKWYYGSGDTWTEFEETSNTLFIPAESKYNRKNIKCEISNDGGSVSTQAVLVYNSTAIQITSQPQDVSCKVNNEDSFNVVATTSTGKAFYQWQYSADGNDWQNIENATDTTYSFKMQDFAMCGYYRCEIDNGGGVLYSEKAKLSGVISIISQPQDVSAFAGNPVEFTIDIGNVAGISYQWQVSKDNGTTWENITDATSTTYSTTMSAEMNAWQYRCKFSVSGLEDTFSNVAKLILLEDVAITTQPVVVSSAIIGTKTTFTVVVSGDDPKYQWQVSYDYGDSWENIIGATNASLNVDVVANIIDNSYRCLVWNNNNVDAPFESEMVWIENTTEPTAFQEWSMANGLGVDALSTATPHNDGITNLEKFVFGLDGSRATSYGANPNFKHSVEGGVASFQFPVRKDASDISVKLMMSNDMSNWEEADAVSIGESGEFNLFNYSAPLPLNGKLFFKLKVLEK